MCHACSSSAGAQLKHGYKAKGRQYVSHSPSPSPFPSISHPPWSTMQVYQFTPECSKITGVAKVLVSLILNPDMPAPRSGTRLQGCRC